MSPTGKGPLRIAIEDFITDFSIGPKIAGWVTSFAEGMELELIEAMENWIVYLGIEDKIPDILKPSTIKSRIKFHQVELAVLIPLFIGIVFSAIRELLAPIGVFTQRLVNKAIKQSRPSPLELIEILKRSPNQEVKIIEWLNDYGFAEDSILLMKDLAKQTLNSMDAETLYRRGLMTETERDYWHQVNGTGPTLAKAISDLYTKIPGVADITSMAVREAWSDETSSRFGYDEGLPPEFGEWLTKQGLSSDWAKRLWRSHWQLPGISQAFEMLQRLRPGVTDNTFTADDLDNLLKAADIPTFFRARLKEISYSPYTRVDIRRMYKVGSLDRDGVYNAYLDAGYNSERAEKLTEFTIGLEAEEETGITKQSVIAAYSDGMIDKSTAQTMLQKSGYDAVSIGFLLDAVDFQHVIEVNKIKMSAIQKQFVEGDIDDVTANNMINALNLPGERVTALMELWKVQRESNVALPTTAQIETLYERGIVTIQDFKDIYKQRGYTDKTTEWALQRIDQEASEKAANVAEAALKEADRLSKLKTATQYQKDKADIDLIIAMDKDKITNINVALHGDLEQSVIDEMSAEKDRLTLEISDYNVKKARLSMDVATVVNERTG